jgi:CheY-like chemotaxis protein
LVDDNSADVRLVKEAIAECGVDVQVRAVSSGEEGLACLRRRAPGEAAVDLVFLDLNLPGLNGQEVLAEAKRDPVLRSVPIVVLSSSAALDDVALAYAAHANSYVVKPESFDECVNQMRCLLTYWCKAVLLPARVSRQVTPDGSAGALS